MFNYNAQMRTAQVIFAEKSQIVYKTIMKTYVVNLTHHLMEVSLIQTISCLGPKHCEESMPTILWSVLLLQVGIQVFFVW